ncbi:TPA: hypothetical protein ACGHF0_003907 [Salmonella enterica subsp. enterica serovar Mississippi]|nr:hypothetical protein [Salmonella enterica subsp. enterica]ECW0527031.1 hypothetical protein [Salmonella enterica subsp. enterica]ECW0837309.1 hypothetical protein [Salmonella enterica subsp. enterica]ECW0995830.1 hypothetical protein [Salmonella enterica subsp. enterica]HEC7107851.1 hypothetical protein [Salmonella enterica subsp. enterica serovar Mississippi]
MKHFSLSRKWILLSLVLLSPEILAAENLNFNYTRADAFSLDPSLGITARACHSLADPIDIKFEFGEMRPPEAIYLKLKGKNYTKGYAVLTPVSGRRTVADARKKDPDFQVPWHVYVGGNVEGTTLIQVGGNTPAVPESYNYPFCFNNDHQYNRSDPTSNTYGYWPVFHPDYFKDVSRYWQITTPDPQGFPQDLFNQSEWNKYCSGRKTAAEAGNYAPNLVWGDPKDNAANAEIKHQVDLNVGFLTYNLFYISRTPAKPGGTAGETMNVPLDPVKDVDSGLEEFDYPFPFNAKNGNGVYLRNGHVSVRLDNRNITSMTLSVYSKYPQDVSTWTWSRDGNNHALMRLAKTGNISIDPVSNQDNSDPYSVLGFYKKQALSHFKGTLVASSSLNDSFKNHVPPLSLPPASDGDFSLVNTDSLTFSMGQPGFSQGQGQGKWTLSVLGQPLKFAPLYINNKEAVSAMQMRNACY